MDLKLRPFSESLSRGSRMTALQISGEIEGSDFFVVVDGERAPLKVRQIGHDDHGDFAIVAAGQSIVLGAQWLTVSAQRPEDMATGAEISLRSTALGSGAGYLGQGFSVFFDERGFVDGQAVVRRSSDPPMMH